ncbi:MAG: hypothetical protein PHU64_03720 [Candidatus Omnitrophica bacterium]|nr:hypothetical protein [Candidatus Omnitrophota bacterium]MDD5429635.1 hypothetical protein [Candidatus Omnitrophota bacterium]
MLKVKSVLYILIAICGLAVCMFLGAKFIRFLNENRVLKEMVLALEADSRIAEVLVSSLKYDEETCKTLTTIKFLEYDKNNNPLEPKYFTFPGNIIQFQSLVARFDDIHIKRKDSLKGRSAYIFWKVFMLDGNKTVEYEITKAYQIPGGYKIDRGKSAFEEQIWRKFWEYALSPESAKKKGIKNVQIEAPGSMFIPGTLYTLVIEHDGGIRIDVKPLPNILKGESIPR